ncbi:MAG: pyrroline-5-carboxylate reductase [Clostridia bacterium]|nr:pyrroline-5-carboxylate reductase [Clostridia bacterium]
MFTRIGMIGTGNMGSAVALAINAGEFEGSFQLANRSKEKAAALADRLKCAEVVDNIRVACRCELIFLAVKPQMMADVLREIAPALRERTDRFVLVTMAAGLTCESIQQMAGGSYPVIRMMPNTPAMIGRGVTQYCGFGATEEELASFAKLLAPSGLVDPIPEKLIDAAAAVSGCGPAFVYQFIEALTDGGVACGLPRATAQKYAAQTVAGAAEMVLTTGKHPGELKDAVCSPGGTTIQGVRALEESGFRAAAMNAVIAAFEKTEELKK